MKPVKFSVAAVIKNPSNLEEILAVKRDPNDESFPGVWALPAVTLKAGELPEDAVRRIGNEKLATKIKPVSTIGIRSADRGDYESILMDVEAKLVGKEPSVKDAVTQGSKYVGQKWTSDYTIFIEAAKKGGLCDRIYLEFKGISWD